MPATKPTAQPKTYQNILGQDFTLEFKDVAFDRTEKGTIITPKNMSLSEAMFWIGLQLAQEEQFVAVNERIEGFPIDVAYALGLAVKELFGIRELRSTPGFFGDDTPPQFISIPINAAGDMVEVFIGRFAIPGAAGHLETGRDWNDALWVKGKLQQKSLPKLRELLAVTRRLLITHSLYRGKAFEVSMTTETRGFEQAATMANPVFMDVTQAPANLMLNEVTSNLIEAAIWRPIERTEQCRRLNISLKRSALLYGPYGTGKSLCALTTARIAEQYDWTFIYLKNVMDLKRVYPVALRYSPVVIFAEDADLIVKHDGEEGNQDGINMVNNMLDGLSRKTAEVMVILTTNHVRQLPTSLLRPGRFDAAIEFELPDRATAARLVRQYAGKDLNAANFDEARVGDALAGNQPATIHEIVRRAQLFCQGRYAPDYDGTLSLATEDFLMSAQSLAPHLALLSATTDHTKTVETAREIVRGWADNFEAVAANHATTAPVAANGHG